MQDGVLETNGVVVTPSSEAVGIVEVCGLRGLQSASGDLFAFDIEASCNAFEVEPNVSFPTLSL